MEEIAVFIAYLIFEALFWTISLLFWGTGAIICWLAKGCQTSLKNELVKEFHMRNGIIAVCFWIVFIVVIIFINN